MRNIIIFVLSLIFLAGQITLIYKVELQNNIPLVISMVVLFLVLLVLIWADSRSRGMNDTLWSILALITGAATIGIIYSLVTFFNKPSN